MKDNSEGVWNGFMEKKERRNVIKLQSQKQQKAKQNKKERQVVWGRFLSAPRTVLVQLPARETGFQPTPHLLP